MPFFFHPYLDERLFPSLSIAVFVWRKRPFSYDDADAGSGDDKALILRKTLRKISPLASRFASYAGCREQTF